MVSKASQRGIGQNRLIGLVIACVLIFAAAHVSLHDPYANDGLLDEHNACHVCRLNHVPVANTVAPPLIAPIRFIAYTLSVANTYYLATHRLRAQRARAPPLS